MSDATPGDTALAAIWLPLVPVAYIVNWLSPFLLPFYDDDGDGIIAGPEENS